VSTSVPERRVICRGVFMVWENGDPDVGIDGANATVVFPQSHDNMWEVSVIKDIKDNLRIAFSNIWDIPRKSVHVMTDAESDEEVDQEEDAFAALVEDVKENGIQFQDCVCTWMKKGKSRAKGNHHLMRCPLWTTTDVQARMPYATFRVNRNAAILSMHSEGESTSDIAKHLGLSVSTIRRIIKG